MKKEYRYIKGLKHGTAKDLSISGSEDSMMSSNEDSALFSDISSYMRAKLDLEDVQKDPAFDRTKAAVKEMIADYNNTLSIKRDNSEEDNFIRAAFAHTIQEKNINSEVKEIKADISKSDINDITADWVREWHKKKQALGAPDIKTKERMDFITGILNSESNPSVEVIIPTIKRNFLRSRFFRYTSLAAAALIGAFMIIRTLLPSSDPEKLFNTYYKPFDAVLPVTRGPGNAEAGLYTGAIASYRTGNYQDAATGFSKSSQVAPAFGSPGFFLGLSEIALGKYDAAISQLNAEVSRSGEYSGEAQWYLGLAYLRTGNKDKAAECFKSLSRSTGFYSDRSLDLLRRLK